MASITSLLSAEDKKVTAEALQGSLVDLLDLSLLGKQAHWNIIGRTFRSLHLHLDEIVTLARDAADSVAERAVAVGVNPDGRARTIAEHTNLHQLEPGYIEDGKVIAAMTDILESMVRRMRERIEMTEKSDLVTQDLLIGITRELEKQHWMIQAQR
ncbi:Dps family protein [Herbidospora sp. RD11066]